MTCSRCGEVRFFDPDITLYEDEAEWSYECSNDECGHLHTFRTSMDEYRDWEARNHIAFRRARIIDTITGDTKPNHTFKWRTRRETQNA
jgi:hypothetical protein